ncbi:fumarylacetoacetate hydrolase family protein [Saccharopolyspora gloriosae]|uniref:fumarylacetoacetate hydrolase family protein n=1 Tax=Saccharopolyspora gloriosae TaxID=455344 RepID=UPI001FB7EF91|nr:fumarylacetoacetate hydrolase family protein [Saccharopolyspora gloriosae]
MRLVRYQAASGPQSGALVGGVLHPLPEPTAEVPIGDPIGSPETLLVPVRPGTVFGLASRVDAEGAALPPAMFLKAVGSVAGPGDPIPLPADIGLVEAAAELAVVVGAPMWRADPELVLTRVLGYTIALDVTAREAQRRDPLWTEAKSRRGFTPLGPWVETRFDAADAAITLRRNGDQVAAGTTATLRIPEILSHLSTLVELSAGDVVLTGAPGTTCPIEPGDAITAEIEGIGELTCPVVTA